MTRTFLDQYYPISRTSSHKMTSIKDITQTDIAHITGQCRCGAVSYLFPLPPSIDVESPDAPQLLKDNIVPPSKQRFPDRGVRPNSNRWRASYCHCAACRQTVGALVVNWVNIPTKDLQIVRNGQTGKYRASNHATREFVRNPFIAYKGKIVPDEVFISAKLVECHFSFWTMMTRILLISLSHLSPHQMSLTISRSMAISG
jgi:hypothetical protein